jgi:biopolymer transport protein ExbD
MLRSRRGGGRNAETAELNITVFMNLMVILVPFLLITAVFSRLAVLDLYLPGAAAETSDPAEQVFQLEVIVRKSKIEVGDRNAGLFGVYPNRAGGYDFDALGRKLSEIKGRYPSKTDVSILLEADILYETLVEVMDKVRVAETVENGTATRYELFPDISIGDAPVADGGA